jgi:hypothetical protein
MAQCQRLKLADPDAGLQGRFGFSSSMAGDTAFVGAPFDDEAGANAGAVFVCRRVDGLWLPMEKLLRPDPAVGDGFGRVVSADESTALFCVVGAGEADVYARGSSGAWSRVTTLGPADEEFDNAFGWAGALSGDTFVVGAPKDNTRAGDAGAVYVFERDPNGNWTQAAELHAADGQAGDELGHSVAIDGERIIAGAWVDDDLGFASGSAYIFERDPNGNWTQAAKLLASDGSPLDFFGSSVAVKGDVAVIGAPCADGATQVTGAAYVFHRNCEGDWLQVRKLTDDVQTTDMFGWSIAIDGAMMIIGARRNTCAGAILAGAAYVYRRQSDGLWALQGVLQAEDCQERDEFGYSVALSGNTAVVGAWLDDDVAPDGGSAYLFRVGPDADGDGVMDACECPGDLDGDFLVSLSDLAIQLANFGLTEDALPEDGDLDGDGDVDLSDLSQLLSLFGTGCQ